jgi:hypothetical protein
VALIDTTPAALSQRMRLVEAGLSGDAKFRITVAPSVLAKRVRQCVGISDVRLWTVPYEALQYHTGLKEDKAARLALHRQLAFFGKPTPLTKGRIQHLYGIYDRQEDRLGARANYLKCRFADREIADRDRLEKLQESVRRHYAVTEEADPQQQLSERLRRIMIEVKQHASYWLALLAYDDSQFEVAVNHLQKRTLKAFPDGLWAQGGRYNLARCYEAIAQRDGDRQKMESAVQLYRSDQQTPQWHGNQLRARRLEARWAERAKAAEPTPTET